MTAAGGRSWAVRRIHNACTLIEVGDVRVLTDPWFKKSRAFKGRASITAAELAPLTAIIGSHWVNDHWNVDDLAHFPERDVPMYVCATHMVDSATDAGFTNVQRVEWGQSLALSDQVTLHVVEEHTGRGGASNNYALVSEDARVFFGGEVLDLEAIRRHMQESEPYDVAIGPVNGVHLLGRQLTVTAVQMLEAARLLGAGTLIPIHDEHRRLPPVLKVTSSARDLDRIEHDDVRVVDLGFGERYAVNR